MIAIIYLLPYLIIIGIVIFIIVKVRKKKGKGPLFRRKKKEISKEKND